MELPHDTCEFLAGHGRPPTCERVAEGWARGRAGKPLPGVAKYATSRGCGYRELCRRRDGSRSVGIPQSHVEERLLALHGEVDRALGEAHRRRHIRHLRASVALRDKHSSCRIDEILEALRRHPTGHMRIIHDRPSQSIRAEEPLVLPGGRGCGTRSGLAVTCDPSQATVLVVEAAELRSIVLR